MADAFTGVVSGESTLSVTYDELRRAVARICGWDRDPANWEGDQLTDGPDMVKAAEREFYTAHNWSFLSPAISITMVAGTYTYDLPDDFAEMEGPLRYSGNYAYQRPITQASLGVVWQNRAVLPTTGIPLYYAIETVAQDGTSSDTGTRYKIQFDITPSQAFVVYGQYRVNPYSMDDTHIYPIGGADHAETLRYAAMSVAEQEWRGTVGPYTARYQQLLERSIRMDLRKGPKILGKNGVPTALANRYRRFGSQILYNGTPVS